MFEAPHFVYAPQEPPAARLLTVLQQLHPKPRDIIEAPSNPARGPDKRSG